jgi:hypothetical protein
MTNKDFIEKLINDIKDDAIYAYYYKPLSSSYHGAIYLKKDDGRYYYKEIPKDHLASEWFEILDIKKFLYSEPILYLREGRLI